jgi:GTP cyclohydrolase I
MEKRFITKMEVEGQARRVAEFLKHDGYVKLYGVPRGGIPCAFEVQNILLGHGIDARVVYSWNEDTIIVDDIIDSGATRDRYKTAKGFFPLFEKEDKWLVFPWEVGEESGPTDAVIRQLQYIGEDPRREGLLDTPKRVVKAWDEIFRGYKMSPSDALGTTFENIEKYDEMVVCKDIAFYSMCEHHLLPFYGRVHIAYVPTERYVGLSKLARIVDVFSRRAQVQERLTAQIADALVGALHPLGVGVVVEGKHLCMMMRGVQQQDSVMTTSALRGAMKQDAMMRAEMLKLFNTKE